MAMHIWINFKVSNCSSIHCYHQNFKDAVLKCILVQQEVEVFGRASVEKVSHGRDDWGEWEEKKQNRIMIKWKRVNIVLPLEYMSFQVFC